MKQPSRVHFVAIGGTGMGSLAGLLKSRGIVVTGSDRALYPPMSTALERWGIPVFEGFDAEQLRRAAPDLVVIGNAVRSDNPEARAAIEGGYRYASFPDALYELAIASRHPVVVSGTHGKTTTTNLVAHLLTATGRDPSLLVGGISLDFDGSFRDGSGEHFVVEGDEYDTAFFDKTPKFLHYHPKTLVVTSIEFDHADIYRDLEHVKSAFRELVEGMPVDGTIAAAGDDDNLRDVLRSASCRVLRYGAERGGDRDAELDWIARQLQPGPEGTRFEVHAPGRAPIPALLPMYGVFNVDNALGALAAVDALGVTPGEAVSALQSLRGVKRRQEVRGEVNGITVIDDFAHHPTAVRASIESLRARYPGRRLVAIFEPRTNTSRRAIFQADYAQSFDAAARVLVHRVPDEPIYSATGDVSERFSADQLTQDVTRRGVPAECFEEVDEIVDHVAQEARPGDVLLVMSNGSFDDIWEKILEALKRA